MSYNIQAKGCPKSLFANNYLFFVITDIAAAFKILYKLEYKKLKDVMTYEPLKWSCSPDV